MSKHTYKFKDHRILSKSEEIELFNIYHSTKSDSIRKQIKQRIINCNMKFAAHVAITYTSKYPHVLLDDLKGYAMMGLIDAFDRFDNTRGIKFISFAVWWIKHHVIKNVQGNESLIRHPGNVHGDLHKRINNNEMTDIDRIMIETMRGGISLSNPLDSNDGSSNKTIGEVLKSDNDADSITEGLDNDMIKEKLNDILSELDDKPRIILEEAFGLNTGDSRTIRAIAKDLDISHENVRYIRDKAIRQIRHKVSEIL